MPVEYLHSMLAQICIAVPESPRTFAMHYVIIAINTGLQSCVADTHSSLFKSGMAVQRSF